MENEEDVRRLLNAGLNDETSSSRVSTALGRARRQVGQRDTLTFALVRIWAVLARLLAPVFATVSERQARALHKHGASSRSLPRRKNNRDEGEIK